MAIARLVSFVLTLGSSTLVLLAGERDLLCRGPAREASGEVAQDGTAYGVALGEGGTEPAVLAEWIEMANQAMTEKKTADARARFAKILSTPGVQPAMAAFAELRVAQSFAMDGDAVAAKTVYARICDNSSYLAHHRQEAKEMLEEMARSSKHLPASEGSESHVVLGKIRKFAAEIRVAPDGNDANPGTEELPVATLQKARDLARAARATAKGPITVILKNGEYPMQDSLVLEAADSGTVEAPVVWQSETPGGAVLYGGTRLRGFTPVSDPAILSRLPAESRGKVVQCDLKAAGITDYGKLAVRGFSQPSSPPTLEVYVNRQAMTLARWPNKGFVPAGKLIQPGNQKSGKPSVFHYADDRHARWTTAEDAWIFGYFHWLWADATAQIGAIDPQAKTLTTAEAYNFNNEGMNEVQGIIYHVFNLLEEIDQPGEWYLNRSTGILYLYPPGDLDHSKAIVEISMLSKPMISATQLAHTRFEGLTLDLSRSDGVILRDSSDCVFVGCTVSRMAGNGVSLLGGNRDLLLSCNIHTIGRTATEVTGGDRPTLTPGNHVVANCEIHHFGRIDRTYTPGIQLNGVGNRVAHNFFHDCPSSAMRIEGNDHLIEYNEVRDAVLESDDQGAMELFGNPTYRGVVFRYNLFADIGLRDPRALANGQAAIRFDDIIIGMLVYGNVFVRAAKGHFGVLNINGGRDNILENNLFVDCPQGVTGGYRSNHKYWQNVRDGKIQECITNALYQQRYPLLSGMLDGKGVNHGSRNIFYHCGSEFVSRPNLDLYSNNSVSGQAAADGMSKAGVLRLQQDAPAVMATGFRPIPIHRIGRYQDSWRPR